MASDVAGKVAGPLWKPEKVEKEPKGLQRRTPLRPYRVDKNGIRILSAPKAPKPKPKRKTINTMFPKGVEPDTMTLDAIRWQATRICWFAAYPPDYDGDYYQCRLCPYPVHKDETTLDHILTRSSHPELIFVLSNLQAAHAVCNNRRGSMTIEAYFNRYPEMALTANEANMIA